MSDTNQSYQLYFWPTPNGKKITIFLEEAHLDYVIKPVNIGDGEQFEPEFLKISPNNKMPALIDPNGPGGEPISLFESGAILQYLGRKTGAFYPITEKAKAEVDQWLFFQMASVGPMSGQCYHFRGLPQDKGNPYGVTRYTKEVTRLYGVMNNQLKDHEFIAGAYSIADMALYPWILPKPLGQNMDNFPYLQAWRERMAGRPAVEKGMMIGADLRQ